jgi:hypothetical protein
VARPARTPEEAHRFPLQRPVNAVLGWTEGGVYDLDELNGMHPARPERFGPRGVQRAARLRDVAGTDSRARRVIGIASQSLLRIYMKNSPT